MSYIECEDAFIAKGQTLNSLFPLNKPWTVSNNLENIKRGADYFIVTLPSTFQSSRVDGHSKQIVWIVLFDFHVRYSEHKKAMRRLAVGRDEIIEHYHSDPLLNKTPGVSSVLISAAGEVLQDIPGANPNFYIQTMTAAITQRVRYTF